MTLQRIHFQSIPVIDQDRALSFYTEKLGFQVHTDAPYDGDWRWIFLRLPGAETRLHLAKPSDIQVHDRPALCLVSDDVDAECVRLRGLDVPVASGPADAPWAKGVRWAIIHDTEGNSILIESLASGRSG